MEVPIAIRPTSETVMYPYYAKVSLPLSLQSKEREREKVEGERERELLTKREGEWLLSSGFVLTEIYPSN